MPPCFKLIATNNAPDRCDLTTQLVKLDRLLGKFYPRSVHMLSICKIGITGNFPRNSIIEFYKYVEHGQGPIIDLGDEEEESDLFIVCVQKPNIHTKTGVVLFPPPRLTKQKITYALDNLLNWNEPFVFQSVPEQAWGAVQDLCGRHGIERDGVEGVMYYMGIEQANKTIELGIDELEFKVTRLKESDAKKLVSCWKWACEHSEVAIEDSIRSLASCGVVHRGTGELVSFVVQTLLGTFNILSTLEGFRGRGLGGVVLKSVCKGVAGSGCGVPLCEVEVGNRGGVRVMESVGFSLGYRTKWFYC